MKSGRTTSIINGSGRSSGGASSAAAERKLQKQTKTPGKGMISKRLSDSFISTKKTPAADLGLAGLDGSIDDCEFIKCIDIGINGIAYLVTASSYAYLAHSFTSAIGCLCVPPFNSCHQYRHSMPP